MLTKSKYTLTAIMLVPLLSITFSTIVHSMDMDHSNHDMSGNNQQKRKVSPWPEENGVDPWADEEFSGLSDELNTEIGTVIHHQHKSGNWMIGYKYMNMYMNGLLIGPDTLKGDTDVSTEQIARTQMGSSPLVPVTGFNYLMAPVDMTMEMHMLMAMYGVSKNTSIMVMTNYLQNDMNMVMHMGNTTTIMRSNYTNMETAGISDTTITAMIRASNSWTISLGANLPTGSIDEKVIMNGNTIQAPYKMQLGSGTFDFLQSVTYKGGDTSFNWGAQESFTYHPGTNKNGYVLGDKMEFSGWVRKTFTNKFSMSTRVNILDENSIEGRDKNIMNSAMSPTFDPANSGKHEINLSVGFSKRFSSGNRLGLEYTKPISQKVNGIQMKTEYTYTLSWSYMM